jgi:hypothetical protein
MSRRATTAKRSARLATALVLCIAAAGLLGGCARKVVVASAPADLLANIAPANLRSMTPAEKTSQIASSFPAQVPVPSGQIQRGEAQGTSAWDYEIVVPGRVSSVLRWYLDAYRNANWTVLSRSATVVTLEKNHAQTRLQLQSVAASPAKTKVTAAVGVGTQVLQTQ